MNHDFSTAKMSRRSLWCVIHMLMWITRGELKLAHARGDGIVKLSYRDMWRL